MQIVYLPFTNIKNINVFLIKQPIFFKMLYKRDYRILTEKEKKIQNKTDALIEKIKIKNKGLTPRQIIKYWDDLPISVVFHKSLFPNNNYIREQDNMEHAEKVVQDFLILVNNKVNEREIQNFIRTYNAYYLITGRILFEFSTGNHDSYIFSEFELPPNHFADYLIIGKNSDGFKFIFVELESVYGDITTKFGEFGTTIRKGLKQIEDWDLWLDANFSHLKLLFDKAKNPEKTLANEFISLDKTRISFAVIVGRRTDFNERANRLRRKYKKNGIAILHYDNLIEHSLIQLEDGRNRPNLKKRILE